MFKLSQIVTKCVAGRKINGLSLVRCNQFSISSPIPEAKTADNSYNTEEASSAKSRNKTTPRSSYSIVAAAFASLQTNGDSTVGVNTPTTDLKISSARTIEELLSISSGSGISRKHALKVVSVLAEWSNSGKVKLSDFETDTRFIRICRVLTRGVKTVNNHESRSEDLSTILSVTADDEAAKLVQSITLPQMVKVMSTLSQRKRRSTQLLRSISYNITASPEQLTLKESADLLYSMSTLSFIDENLLVKVCHDISVALHKEELKKGTVVGSIVTSLGLMKYKEPGTLNSLCEWFQNNQAICRSQDIFGLFITLATLNYNPPNREVLYTRVRPSLTLAEAGKPTVWLGVVWALVLLNQADSAMISEVLSENFLRKLNEGAVSTSTKLKLLNIEAATKFLLTSYQGNHLPLDSNIHGVTIKRTREKQDMVDSVVDTLKNLIQSEGHLKTDVDTGLGFFIDIQCLLDKKCNALKIDSNNDRSDLFKVAIMVYDFHDMCKGQVEPSGVSNFAIRLLEAQGYKILKVPYTEYRTSDKLIHRVQYLESQLKSIVK